jgi:hypothetical protein
MPNAVELFNELIRLGYVTPVSDQPNLMMPTMYRSVPSVTTSGTAEPMIKGSASAQLERRSRRDQEG